MWESFNLNPFNLFIGLCVGILTGVITSHYGKYIKTQEEDKSLKGILILWKRSPIKTMLLTAILAPIFEELLFRFLGISLIRMVTPEFIAILVTSILFGLAHNQYPINIITGIIGLILAIVYQSYGLIAAMLAHSVHNVISIVYLKRKAERFLSMDLSQALNQMSISEIINILEV